MRAHLESSVSSTQQSPRRFFRHGLHEAGVLYRSIALDRQITLGGNTRCCLICTATLAVLIMIGVFFVILLPACIIQAIVYRRARKDINDMPNYTGVNGPQYGVTGYPQGAEAPGRSWYTGFSPPWSYKHPYTGRHGTPGSFPANGYATLRRKLARTEQPGSLTRT